MSLEKGRISSSQLIFLVMSYMSGISLVIPPGIASKQDAWIAIILGLIEGLFISFIYIYLSNRFPEKTFIEISEIIYGTYLGKLISFVMLLYFFHVGSLIVIDLSYFFNGIFFPGTPVKVFVIVITLVSASAVRNGIEVIARCSQVIIPLIYFTFILIGILLLKDINTENYFPLFETPIKKMAWAVHRTAVFPFAPGLFLMIIPFVNKQGEVKKSIITGSVISALLLIFITLINIGVLGGTASIYTYPTFHTVRLINYGEIINRLEILVALTFLVSGFFHYTLTFYGLTLGSAQLLGLKTYLPLVLPIGVLLTFQLHYYNIIESIEYQNMYPIIATMFKVIIPLMTVVVAIVRKLPGKE